MRAPNFAELVIGVEVLTLAAVVAASFGRVLPEGSQQPVMLVVGAFIAHIGTFVSFKWTSSQGSRDKDARVAPAPPAPPAPPPAPG